MKEKTIVLVACILLLAASFVVAYFSFYDSDFNFYKAELTINGSYIEETLYYSPDTDYHTLFRTFMDSSYLYPEHGENSVSVNDVACSDGSPYFFSSDYMFYSFDLDSVKADSSWPNTEANEYGCSFGDNYGFFKGEEYIVMANYIITGKNLFVVNGTPYTKFVVYSPKKHVALHAGENFIITGDVSYKKDYFPKDSVVVYIPFNGDVSNKKLTYLDDFEYDSSYRDYFLTLLLGFIPAILFYLIWYFLGKENLDIGVPSSLSSAPAKRKAWEVAAYFRPPFHAAGKNFISSLILELFNRKIVDIKVEKAFFGNKCFIKILNKKAKMDSTEKEFIEILLYAQSNYTGKYSNDGYLNLDKLPMKIKNKVSTKFVSLERSVEKAGKRYLESKGVAVFFIGNVALIALFGYFLNNFILAIVPFIAMFIGFFLQSTSSVFVKFNGNYYKEYLEWQSFRKYLNSAPSLKLHGHRGVVVWGEYLTYAAALGVSARVIEELKNEGLISPEQYSSYTSVGYFSSSMVSSGATGSSHGGAGGGGVGGGGGGGR